MQIYIRGVKRSLNWCNRFHTHCATFNITLALSYFSFTRKQYKVAPGVFSSILLSAVGKLHECSCYNHKSVWSHTEIVKTLTAIFLDSNNSCILLVGVHLSWNFKHENSFVCSIDLFFCTLRNGSVCQTLLHWYVIRRVLILKYKVNTGNICLQYCCKMDSIAVLVGLQHQMKHIVL